MRESHCTLCAQWLSRIYRSILNTKHAFARLIASSVPFNVIGFIPSALFTSERSMLIFVDVVLAKPRTVSPLRPISKEFTG